MFSSKFSKRPILTKSPTSPWFFLTIELFLTILVKIYNLMKDLAKSYWMNVLVLKLDDPNSSYRLSKSGPIGKIINCTVYEKPKDQLHHSKLTFFFTISNYLI